MVNKDKHGNLSTDLFRKSTDARNYLQYSSAHPKSCKDGISYSQLLRVRRIRSEYKRFEANAIEMARSFIERGYPRDLVEMAMVRASRRSREDLLRPIEQPKTDKMTSESVFVMTTYNPAQNILNDIVRKYTPYLQKIPNTGFYKTLR